MKSGEKIPFTMMYNAHIKNVVVVVGLPGWISMAPLSVPSTGLLLRT